MLYNSSVFLDCYYLIYALVKSQNKLVKEKLETEVKDEQLVIYWENDKFGDFGEVLTFHGNDHKS